MHRYQAGVGYGDSVRVAANVFHYMLWGGEGLLHIHDPLSALQLGQKFLALDRIGVFSQSSGVANMAFL
jgi:hypothetical protein